MRRTQGGGNPYIVPVGQMSEEDKAVFADKCDMFIENVNKMIGLGSDLSQPHLPISPLQYGEELDKHNEQMQSYIKAQFGYNYTSTVIGVQIPALMTNS